ncbi:spherulation-specific family 4 protein [Kitasatospora viridis]|uniref:Spherulation-specific family 4 protein n=1 Tax=Kitasatospora viridis TaxID=281105 RepID=A0A561TTK3_9ACTN|nr:spherulation-specific family 4 protein [Kitasatospora viridis]TWF90440.1 spherulation-specific family 4 protein [Kitasatospora viridis]
MTVPLLLVPLYVHPGVAPDAWRAVAEAGPARVGAVVLNVADGPGAAPDPAFAEAGGRLRAAGVRVLGYSDTDYGRRPHAAVVDDLLRYREWYGVEGVYFDQASAHPGALGHYRRLATAARAAGCGTVVLGHGTHPDPGYAEVGLADLLVTFEGTWDAYQDLVPPVWTGRHAPARFCHLVYEVPADRAEQFAKLAGGHRAGLACAVSGPGPNPWDTEPLGLRR